MVELLFSPLAPTVMFLVGAFVVAELPRKSHVSLGFSLVILALLVSRLVFQLPISYEDAPQVFSGWGDGSGLTMRIDGLSIAFLLIPALLLVALMWAHQARDHLVLLATASGASAVFVAANGISFSYALLLFDMAGCFFWLRRAQPNLAIMRMILALTTTSVLMLAGLQQSLGLADQILALILWFRVGLLPFVEVTYARVEADKSGDLMVWFALSTAVGVYIGARFLAIPLPRFVIILLIAVMLLNAGLAWLTNTQQRKTRLLYMILIKPALAFLIAPIVAEVSITLGLVYTLSLGILWLTPQLGRPNIRQRHWLWVYTAPFLATLSLIAFPLTVGWLASEWLYADLWASGQTVLVSAVLLAEGVALSVLYHYWQWLWAGDGVDGVAVRAALILAVPFLVPWLGGETFSIITGFDLLNRSSGPPVSIWFTVGIIWLIALGFGLGRRAIMGALPFNPGAMLRLTWLWPYAGYYVDWVGRGVLRLKSVLEGMHYLGWAFLVALAGILVVVLR